MNKKSIIILAVLVVVIVGVFIANNLIGAKVAESVDQQLQTMIREEGHKWPFSVEYSRVTSSPVSGSITIHDYRITEPSENFEMTGSSVELEMPLSEILALRNQKDLKSVKEMSVTMVSPRMEVEGASVFKADYFSLAYDGELSLFELQNAEEGILPKTRQAVSVSAKGMKVDEKMLSTVFEDLIPPGSSLPFSSVMQEQFREEADFEISAEFDPDRKMFMLHNYTSKNGFTDMSAFGEIKFSGETVEDFDPESGEFSMNYEVKAYEIDYPEYGKFTFDGGEADMKVDFQMSEENQLIPGVPDFNIVLDMSMGGMEIDLGEEIIPNLNQMGVPLDKSSVKINGIEINFVKKGDDINLKTFEIDIEDLIKLEARAQLEKGMAKDFFGKEQETTVFKSSKIEISGLSDSMEKLIQSLEESMPKPFPRKGNTIVIELSGNISDPQIKGVTD